VRSPQRSYGFLLAVGLKKRHVGNAALPRPAQFIGMDVRLHEGVNDEQVSTVHKAEVQRIGHER